MAQIEINTQTGYITGFVAKPLSTSERENKGHGYEAHEWLALTGENGLRKRIPFRIEHGDESTRIGTVHQTMVMNTPDGPMLAVGGMLDVKNPLMEKVHEIKNAGGGLSWAFNAYPSKNSGRYLNDLREISFVRNPAHQEARIIVMSSADAPKPHEDTVVPDAPEIDASQRELIDLVTSNKTADEVAAGLSKFWQTMKAAERERDTYRAQVEANQKIVEEHKSRLAAEEAERVKKQGEQLADLKDVLAAEGIDITDEKIRDEYLAPGYTKLVSAWHKTYQSANTSQRQSAAMLRKAQLESTLSKTLEERGTKRPSESNKSSTQKRIAVDPDVASAVGLDKLQPDLLKSVESSVSSQSDSPATPESSSMVPEQRRVPGESPVYASIREAIELFRSGAVPVKCSAIADDIARTSIYGRCFLSPNAIQLFFGEQEAGYAEGRRLHTTYRTICPWRYDLLSGQKKPALDAQQPAWTSPFSSAF